MPQVKTLNTSVRMDKGDQAESIMQMKKDFEESKARLLQAKRLQLITKLKKKYQECKAKLITQERINVTLHKQNKSLQDEKKSLQSDIGQIRNQNRELRDHITKHIVAGFDFKMFDDPFEFTLEEDSTTATTIITPQKPKRYHKKMTKQGGKKAKPGGQIENNATRPQKRSCAPSNTFTYPEDTAANKRQRTRRTSPRKK